MTFGRFIEQARQTSGLRRIPQRSPAARHSISGTRCFTSWRQATEWQLVAVAVGAAVTAWFTFAAAALFQGG
ncbi:MAG: hypothetical protein ACJ8IR_13355 [Alphaproteobacteria bacterium]|jgi:hypothetical protein